MSKQYSNAHAQADDGRLTRVGYATDADARDAIERFGQAASYDRQDDAAGIRYVVECPTQRGKTGGTGLHAIACTLRIPVHIL